VIDQIAVREKKVGLDAADEPSDTSGTQPVLPEAFVDYLVDSNLHSLSSRFSPFNVKISSVEHPNTLAKVSASGKLGTYRSRSIELMLCRDTPTASASCSCVQQRATRSSLTRFRIFGGM
jgi:hypothetical protein